PNASSNSGPNPPKNPSLYENNVQKYKNESTQDREKRLDDWRKNTDDLEKRQRDLFIRQYGGQEKWDADNAKSSKIWDERNASQQKFRNSTKNRDALFGTQE